jgi:hypothetical protein
VIQFQVNYQDYTNTENLLSISKKTKQSIKMLQADTPRYFGFYKTEVTWGDIIHQKHDCYKMT